MSKYFYLLKLRRRYKHVAVTSRHNFVLNRKTRFDEETAFCVIQQIKYRSFMRTNLNGWMIQYTISETSIIVQKELLFYSFVLNTYLSVG